MVIKGQLQHTRGRGGAGGGAQKQLNVGVTFLACVHAAGLTALDWNRLNAISEADSRHTRFVFSLFAAVVVSGC